MKIEFLGTIGNIESSAPHYFKHSGVLVDEKILLDVGEKEFLSRNPKTIFITHLHPDHAFFVNQKIDELGIPTYAPEKSNSLSNLKQISGTVIEDSYKISPIPTHHSQKVKSTVYLVEHGSHRLLYTGDLISINEGFLKLVENLDLVITDGSFIRRKGLIRREKVTGRLYGHNGIPDIVEMFRDFAGRIIFTHFGSWFFKDIENSKTMITALGNGTKVESAYDGWL